MKSNSINKAAILVVASHSAWAQRQGMVETFCQVLDALTKRKDTDVAAVVLVNGDKAKVLAEHAQGDPEGVVRKIAAVHPRGHSYLGEAKSLALDLLPEDTAHAELFVISNGQSVDDTSKIDQEIMRRVQAGTLTVHALLYGMTYEETVPRPLAQKEWVDLKGQYIAMDGTNVCGWSTRRGCPKLNQLLAICRYCRMGGVDYTAWFDPSFKYCLEKFDPAAGRTLQALLNTRPDRFKEVPAGLLNGQPIKADTFVLNDAAAHNGWYLANDLYRAEANDNPARYGWVKDASDKRIAGQVSGNYIFLEPIGWKIQINDKIK